MPFAQARVPVALVFFFSLAIASCSSSSDPDLSPITQPRVMAEGVSGEWKWQVTGWETVDGFCFRLRAQPGQRGGLCASHEDFSDPVSGPLLRMSGYDFAGPHTLLTMFGTSDVETVLAHPGAVPFSIESFGSASQPKLVLLAARDSDWFNEFEALDPGGQVVARLVCAGPRDWGVVPGHGCVNELA
jgi:hypothetical protein